MIVVYLPLLMTSTRPIECKQIKLFSQYNLLEYKSHFYNLTTIDRINMFMEGRLCGYDRGNDT